MHASTADESTGAAGLRGSAKGGPACSSQRPGSAKTSDARSSRVHTGRTASRAAMPSVCISTRSRTKQPLHAAPEDTPQKIARSELRRHRRRRRRGRRFIGGDRRRRNALGELRAQVRGELLSDVRRELLDDSCTAELRERAGQRVIDDKLHARALVYFRERKS